MANSLFPMVQGDLEPGLEIVVLDTDGLVQNLALADSVRLRFATGDGVELWTRPVIVDNAASGVTHYDWQAGDTDTAGYYRVQIIVTWSGSPERPQTYPAASSIWILIVPRL